MAKGFSTFACAIVIGISIWSLFKTNLVSKQSDSQTNVPITQMDGVLDVPEILRSKPYVVNVWGTWCMACKAEHGLLMELAAEGVPILGISLYSDPASVEAWFLNEGDPYFHNYSDDNGTLSKALGINGAPVTFLVGVDGRTLLRHTGKLDEKAWQSLFRQHFVTQQVVQSSQGSL